MAQLLTLDKEAHVFYVGRTENLDEEMLFELAKLFELKEFVLIYYQPNKKKAKR